MDFSNLSKLLGNILVEPKIELPHGVIDDETLVSMDFYRQKDWKLVLYNYDDLSYIQVDFFVQYLRKFHIESVETFLYSWEDIRYFKSIQSEYQSIKDIFYNVDPTDRDWSSHGVIASAILITNKALDFIVYIDEFREKFYFYGNRELRKMMMPVSFEAFQDYYGANYEIFEHEPLRIDYLKWLWKHYIAIGGTGDSFHL